MIKPNVSAGSRDTGRFGPGAHDLGRGLIGEIHASGRIAMVQPYKATVDTVGETAVLCIDGEPVHTLRKGAVLRPDEVAPIREGGPGAAEAMYDPELVTPAEATDAELEQRARDRRPGRRAIRLPAALRPGRHGPGADGEPVLLELELIEPNFYLDQVPATTAVVADAIIARAGQR